MKVVKLISLGLVSVLLLGLTIVSFSSCNHAPEGTPVKSWGEKFSEMDGDWNEAGSLMDHFGEQRNVPVNDLTVYEYDRFIGLHRRRYDRGSFGMQIDALSSYNLYFPIEHVKAVDENTVCVVYKFETDATDATEREVLAYVVFQRRVASMTEKDGVDQAGEYERWESNGEVYLVTETLTQADFASVEIGDSLLSVSELDPAVAVDASYYSYCDRAENRFSTASYRILSDGILIIDFEAPLNAEGYVSEASDIKVVKKTFYSYHGASSPKDVSLSLSEISALIKPES